MAQPVWVLSVDLQTRTATFQSGMADAARSARGAFQDIKTGASGMAAETGYSMTGARHGVMLLGEEFGVHLPRALMSFIAGLGPVGAAMEAAFPFLAIVVGATLLLEHLAKLRAEGEKLTENQGKFLAATSNAFNALDEKLLQAGIKADELNGSHLAALQKQLELIDRQSMAELVHSFDLVAKAADVVMGELKATWYQFGIGSAGAQHALTQFKTQYDALLAQGKDKEASDLLSGTRASAEHILQMQKQMAASRVTPTGTTADDANYNNYVAASNELKKAGVGITDKEVQAQQALVNALQAQATVQEKVSALKNLQGQNAEQTTGNKMDDENEKRLKMQEEAEKQELEAEDRLREQARQKAITDLQQAEREQIDATQKGTSARLQVIEGAIKEEERYGLQDTAFYRTLLTQRVETTRVMAEEEAKVRAEAGKIEAEHDLKMGELGIAADKEQAALRVSGRRQSLQDILALEAVFAEREYQLKMDSYSKETAALNQNDKDYENKLKQIQNKELELTKQHENEITAIQDKAEKKRNADLLAADTSMANGISKALSDTLLRHQSFAAVMGSIGDQLVTQTIQATIEYMFALDMPKEKEAAAAGRKGWLAGQKFPYPLDTVMPYVLAALSFAAVMAFEKGGIVPGSGRGDIVPAMLEPGEAVLPKSMVDAARSGGNSGSGGTVHLHYRPTYHVQTIDSGGIRDTLKKHNEEFSRHFESTLRKMNRG
jgi:hypothetical protein